MSRRLQPDPELQEPIRAMVLPASEAELPPPFRDTPYTTTTTTTTIFDPHTIRQLYRLGRLAQDRLSDEASQPDHSLLRLIGHTSLLDALAAELEAVDQEVDWCREDSSDDEEAEEEESLLQYDIVEAEEVEEGPDDDEQGGPYRFMSHRSSSSSSSSSNGSSRSTSDDGEESDSDDEADEWEDWDAEEDSPITAKPVVGRSKPANLLERVYTKLYPRNPASNKPSADSVADEARLHLADLHWDGPPELVLQELLVGIAVH